MEIDGVDVRKIELASMGQVIGFVTQETFLFHASVRENLRYAKPEATDRELQVAARMAAIHDRIALCPKAMTPSSASAATSSQEARSSASRSPGCCSRTRGYSCLTKRPQPSIPCRSD